MRTFFVHTSGRITHHYSSHTGKQVDLMPAIFVTALTFPRWARAMSPSRKTRHFGLFPLSVNIYYIYTYIFLVFARRPLHLLASRMHKSFAVPTRWLSQIAPVSRSTITFVCPPWTQHVRHIYFVCSGCALYSLANMRPCCSSTFSGSTGVNSSSARSWFSRERTARQCALSRTSH